MQKHLKFSNVHACGEYDIHVRAMVPTRPLAHPTYDMYYCNKIKYNAF